MGKHNVANALVAYCRQSAWAATRARCHQGAFHFEQTGRRQKVVHSKGVTVIEDCYNANPDSMKAALAMFKEFPCKRRFALLGDMLELGELSREAHEELGRLAAESDLYCLVTYGETQSARLWWLRPRGSRPPCQQLPRGSGCSAEPDRAGRCPAGEGKPRHGAGKKCWKFSTQSRKMPKNNPLA